MLITIVEYVKSMGISWLAPLVFGLIGILVVFLCALIIKLLTMVTNKIKNAVIKRILTNFITELQTAMSIAQKAGTLAYNNSLSTAKADGTLTAGEVKLALKASESAFWTSLSKSTFEAIKDTTGIDEITNAILSWIKGKLRLTDSNNSDRD
jgi:hypothetical protein